MTTPATVLVTIALVLAVVALALATITLVALHRYARHVDHLLAPLLPTPSHRTRGNTP